MFILLSLELKVDRQPFCEMESRIGVEPILLTGGGKCPKPLDERDGWLQTYVTAGVTCENHRSRYNRQVFPAVGKFNIGITAVEIW